MTRGMLALADEAQTEALGRRLGELLQAGDVVGLQGPLGAGKTRLAQAIAAALGVEEDVSSPTFVLMKRYRGRWPVYHLDAYRLRDGDEFAELGPEEFLGGENVAIIEWSDRVAAWLPEDRLELRLETTGRDARSLLVEGLAGRGAALAAALLRPPAPRIAGGQPRG